MVTHDGQPSAPRRSWGTTALPVGAGAGAMVTGAAALAGGPADWALGTVAGGAAVLWAGVWAAWLAKGSWRRDFWSLAAPVGVLTAVGVGGTVAMSMDAGTGRIPDAGLLSCVVVTVVTVVAAVTVYAAQVSRFDYTVDIAPRHGDTERTFPAVLLGDDTGPGGFPRHSHIVVGPGVLACTNDPAGAHRREPLPAGLVLERVRHPRATDPAVVADAAGGMYYVAQCRDGDREVLIAVGRGAMPWLVGALTPPGGAPRSG
ncbi:hypothetical protein ACFWUQ_30115 [Streptomyces sp. NPDC058662]|uniref:hypothetical protein n=1 Tax=Streptomyces sp. NPDC058662 TaxID=3346583 RepID=UPI00365B3C3F